MGENVSFKVFLKGTEEEEVEQINKHYSFTFILPFQFTQTPLIIK